MSALPTYAHTFERDGLRVVASLHPRDGLRVVVSRRRADGEWSPPEAGTHKHLAGFDLSDLPWLKNAYPVAAALEKVAEAFGRWRR